MDDWKQRVKIVLDQIYAVDPYYVQSNETRIVNQISYADIAAGRTSPSSRGSSPFRNPRDEVSSVPLSIQVLKPTVQLSRTMEAQKQPAIEPTGDNTPANAAIAETKMKEEQSRPEEQNEQKEPEVRTEVRRRVSKVDSVDSRLRNQSRRSGSVRKDVRGPIRESPERNSSAEADNEISGSDASRSVVEQRKDPFVLKNTLAPKVERRGRSASPIWMPGSTSYADILRGNRQNSRSPSVETGKDAHVVGREVAETVVEESSVETVQTEKMEFEVAKVEVKEGATAENAFMEQPSEDVAVESYQQQPAEVVHEVVPEVESPVKTSEEPSETQTSWTDESMDEYVLLNEKSYENVARPPVATQQVPEVYNYIHPAIPELVGFIGSQIAYPVSSYVYMPAAPPQQMALPHYTESQMAFPSEPYVAQPSYIPEPEIYQQNQLQKHPQRHPHQTKFKIPPKTTPVVVQNVEEKCLPSRAQQPVDIEPVVQSNIQAAAQPAVQAEEVSEPEKPVEPEQSMQQPIEQPVQQVSTPVAESTPIKTKSTTSSESKTFSYAQILSQGLSSKPTSTTSSQSSTTVTLISKQAKERSRSPVNSATSSVHESSPPQEARQIRESTVGKSANTWDISRRRETRKTHQESPKTKIPEKRARRGPEQPKASEVFQKPQKEKVRTSTEQQKQVFEFKDEITVEDLTASPKVTPKSVKVEIRKEQVDDVKPEKRIDAEETKKMEDHKQDEKDVQEEKEVDVQQRSRSQEKKRKAKKKKPEKVDDEIEKALKEIEDMDKHKKRDKSREQAKKDTVQATVEKSKEES
ncbi:neurofilament heavy polypeptide-like [Bombus impatiens]|uniref:Neurofilament heavy polypeptide-like n=1 Tax=Bombus impatiens TaxID=132113 RepID=A0A6P8LE52_BOMIM|nr:neurofilament heavy polypeptide-like [Bombus impatiens]